MSDRPPNRRRRLQTLALGTAFASVLLASCTTAGPPRADLAAGEARLALEQGNEGRAIARAEAAVAAEPHMAEWRMVLGNAYLAAGRFASAETSFSDAMTLGDNSPRAALSLALAQTAQGRYQQAAAVLEDWQDEIAPVDLGLALALAGQPERGIAILADAIRGGQNTAKARQNLAFAYAVAGRWRESRLMVQQDVPAHEVGARMAQWAQLAGADAYQSRVAQLLGVPAGVRDPGQPLHLALASPAAIEQFASEASAYVAPPAMAAPAEQAAQVAAAAELPALDPAAAPAPAIALDAPAAPARESFASAFATVAPTGPSLAAATADAIRFVSDPVVQTTPVRNGAAPARAGNAPARAAASVASAAGGDHLVQLGSFSSEQGARRAWGIYVRRHPELAAHDTVITEALVRGQRFWRVSAGGLNQQASRALCNRVRASSGEGCVTWAANRPLPGAVDAGVRLARR